MKRSVKVGVSFGLTSGIITTLGLMVGLAFGTKSELVVIGGIITIAIADAFSDSLGIHISEESQKSNSAKDVWTSTISTFLSKFFFALTFLVPLLIFDLLIAVLASIVWGLSVLALLSWYVAKTQGESPFKVVLEHLTIGVLVVVITYFVGEGVSTYIL